jgi:hypothetical protein
VTPMCLIPVRCPHCSAVFAIDPSLETASIAEGPLDEPPTAPLPAAAVSFRPVCPGCHRRVSVRVSHPSSDR